MAQRVITQIIDDIDGSEVEDGAGRTVNFALDGAQYQIDLAQKNIDKLEKAFQPYIDAVRKVGGRRNRGGSAKTGSGRDVKAIRQWAQDNGYDVPARGRMPQNLVEEYDAAH